MSRQTASERTLAAAQSAVQAAANAVLSCAQALRACSEATTTRRNANAVGFEVVETDEDGE